MSALASIGLINTIASIGLTLVVWVRAPRRDLARAYSFTNLAVAWWSFFFFIWQIQTTAQASEWPMRLLVTGGVCVNQGFLTTTFTLAGVSQSRRMWLHITLAMSAIFAGVILTGHLYGPFTPAFNLGYWPSANRWTVAYLVFWHAEVLAGFVVMLSALRSATGVTRKQMLYFMSGSALGYLGGFSTWPIWFRIYFPPHLVALVSLYLAFVAYAIVKHQLMDISIVIRKTLVYSAVTAVLTALYVLITMSLARGLSGWVVSPSGFSSGAAACAMALLFHPLRMKIQRFVDRHFFRESLDQALLREATSGFVHEIKRPLANISLPAELSLMDLQELLDGSRSTQEVLPKVLQRLRYILEQTTDAGDKIEAIREVSNSDRRQAQDLDLLEIIRRGVEAEKPLCRRHQVEVKLDFKEDPLTIRGHPKQLEIVVTNLIKNAVEAMAGSKEQRERVIVISVGRSENHASMSVQDTGPGINPENLPHLFEPYFTTKGVHGMGMGLFLCRQIVQAHGGTLDVRSEPGRGAEFIVRLPVRN